MGKYIRSFIEGMGSVMNIWQAPDFSDYVTNKSNNELLQENFDLVFNSIRESIEDLRPEYEQGK